MSLGSRPADHILNSMLGLVTVYNRLPEEVVESSPSVAIFHSALQQVVNEHASIGRSDWMDICGARGCRCAAMQFVTENCAIGVFWSWDRVFIVVLGVMIVDKLEEMSY